MMEWLHTGLSLTGLLQDVRYGLRQLRKSPGFTTAAVVTLALGIGATTAIFSLVDGLMLKPLSFPNADRLARIESVLVSTGDGGVASYPDFVDWRAENHSFEGMGVFETKDFTLAGRRESLHLQGAVVSAQLFSLLGVTPAFGRTFLSEEDSPVATNGTDSVILSYGLWQREFGSDASILGRAIRLDGQPFTVVGVMRPSFQFPVRAESVELWTTIAIDAHGGVNATTANRGAHYLDVIGLLKQGVSLRQAQTEMVTVASGLNHQHPEVKPRTVRILPETQALIGPLRAPLSVLLGAVLCVLLLVCANLANLQLARATSRQKEMAVRAALGASRRRVVCQLITESVTLGLMGGSLGLGLALQSVQILVRLLPVEVPRLNAIGLDARLLGFTFLISVLAGVLFGIAPALRVSKIGLTESLMERGQGSGSDAKRYGGLRNVLVVSEVALAAVLLPGAALLIQSFLHLTQVDPGFDPHHVLAFQLDSSPTFLHDVVTQMSAQPGVSSASAVASLPLTGDNIRCSIEIEGQPTPIGSRPSSDFNAIEPNYLRTLGIALVAGRDFTERDDLNSTPVAIINRTLARRFFPNQDPIGKHIRPGIGAGGNAGEPPMREIVGVVGDVKQGSLGVEPAPEVYTPSEQNSFGSMFVVVRTAIDPRTMVEQARRQVASLDKNVPVYHVETLDGYFAQAVAVPQFVALLVSSFAGFAMLLATVGVYGVMSYVVAQRTHEIGVRMALGAKPSDVLRLVVGQGFQPTLIGLVIGVSGAFGLARLLSTLLYGIKSTDPLTFIVVPLMLTVAALIASYIPARRAARVDPMVALRYE